MNRETRQVRLDKAYLKECAERLGRCEHLTARMFPGCERGVYDELHQEFDSLSSAARAVDRGHDELLFFELARYIRFLRDARALKIDGYEHALIAFSISLYRQCSEGEISRDTYTKAATATLNALSEIAHKSQGSEECQPDAHAAASDVRKRHE